MKVLIIRDKTLSFNGGIKRHCDDLYALMSACDVDVMPVEDLPVLSKAFMRASITESFFSSNASRVLVNITLPNSIAPKKVSLKQVY